MPTIAASRVPKPESWGEFEEIVRDLFAILWRDPNAQRHGRTAYAEPYREYGLFVPNETL